MNNKKLFLLFWIMCLCVPFYAQNGYGGQLVRKDTVSTTQQYNQRQRPQVPGYSNPSGNKPETQNNYRPNSYTPQSQATKSFTPSAGYYSSRTNSGKSSGEQLMKNVKTSSRMDILITAQMSVTGVDPFQPAFGLQFGMAKKWGFYLRCAKTLSGGGYTFSSLSWTTGTVKTDYSALSAGALWHIAKPLYCR